MENDRKPKAEDMIRSASSGLKAYLPYSQLGFEIVGSVILCVGIGYAMDSWLGTGHLFLVIFGVVGVGAAVLISIRAMKSINHLEKRT